MAYTPEQIRLKAAHSKAPKKEREPSVISEKQQAYVDAIMTGANANTACAVSGYHPTTVGNEMRNETVRQILAEARKEVSDLTTIKRLDVLNMFMEAISMARTMADPANMINGADKICKMMGYYAPETKKIELTMDQGRLHDKIRQLSDQELMELASSTAKVVEGEVLS
ncbi:MAG: hypothetical protein IPN20_04505 [Haliscomenobacter sp.]|nr:hypothetical protein [Haliscomenobacter sp.]